MKAIGAVGRALRQLAVQSIDISLRNGCDFQDSQLRHNFRLNEQSILMGCGRTEPYQMLTLEPFRQITHRGCLARRLVIS
jgi:hypothetical protein